MKEIQAIVSEKVNSLINDGTLQKMIENGIEEAIEKSISAQFKSYGHITEQIEKALKVGLQINTADLPFEVYNKQMLSAIKVKLGNMFAGQASERFMEEMDALLAPVPKEMPITEFVETIVKTWREELYDWEDADEYATVELENCEIIQGNYNLRIWQKQETGYSVTRERSPDLNLHINSDGVIRINHQQAYNPTCFSSHEAYVFKAYAAGTVLTGLDEFSPDDCDLSLREEDY